jgi:hypothetical protein
MTKTISLQLDKLSVQALEQLLPAFIVGGLYDELDHLIGEVVRRLDLAVEEDRDNEAGTLLSLLQDHDVDTDELDLYRMGA